MFQVGCHEPEILPLDLTDYGQHALKVEQAMAMHGRIDVLINNGGVSFRGEIADTDLSVDQRVMAVNYFGQVALTKGEEVEVDDCHRKLKYMVAMLEDDTEKLTFATKKSHG
jgi:short-subunit dehydrogenase